MRFETEERDGEWVVIDTHTGRASTRIRTALIAEIVAWSLNENRYLQAQQLLAPTLEAPACARS